MGYKLLPGAVTVAVAVASAFWAAAPVFAADSTTDFEVRVTITSTCNAGAVTATNVDFGTLPSSSVNATASGQLQVICTSGTSYTIALDAGDNESGGSRRMRNGTNYLSYGLYHTAGTTQPWSSTLGELHSGSGTGSIQAIPVYGVLPTANAPAGAYVDIVTATLTY